MERTGRGGEWEKVRDAGNLREGIELGDYGCCRKEDRMGERKAVAG